MMTKSKLASFVDLIQQTGATHNNTNPEAVIDGLVDVVARMLIYIISARHSH